MSSSHSACDPAAGSPRLEQRPLGAELTGSGRGLRSEGAAPLAAVRARLNSGWIYPSAGRLTQLFTGGGADDDYGLLQVFVRPCSTGRRGRRRGGEHFEMERPPERHRRAEASTRLA